VTHTADILAAYRGRAQGATARLAALNLNQTARGIDLAYLDHTAAHQPTPGTSSRTSDISDPTHHAATRRKPADPHHTLRQLSAALDTLTRITDWLDSMSRLGDPDPRNRPEHGHPCQGATLHQPDDHGNCTAAGCGKRWPTCTPDAAPRWEDCPGTIPLGSTRCARCDLTLGHTICRSCCEIKTSGRPTMQNSTTCKGCYMAERRRLAEPVTTTGSCVTTETGLDS